MTGVRVNPLQTLITQAWKMMQSMNQKTREDDEVLDLLLRLFLFSTVSPAVTLMSVTLVRSRTQFWCQIMNVLSTQSGFLQCCSNSTVQKTNLWRTWDEPQIEVKISCRSNQQPLLYVRNCRKILTSCEGFRVVCCTTPWCCTSPQLPSCSCPCASAWANLPSFIARSF